MSWLTNRGIFICPIIAGFTVLFKECRLAGGREVERKLLYEYARGLFRL